MAKKFITKAITHPGVEKKAAKRAGMSTQAYMHAHIHDSGTAGKRARLGITLTKMAKRSAHGSGVFTEAEMKQGYKTISRGCNYDDMGLWNSEHQNAGNKFSISGPNSKRKEQSY